MEEKEIIELIERYFEGETSVEEERRLRDALFRCGSEDARVVEAKAVMAYAALGPAGGRPSGSGLRSAGWRDSIGRCQGVLKRSGIAAAVAAAVVCAASLLWPEMERSGCYTMTACVESLSQETAFDLMGSQLQAMGEASEEIDESVRENLNFMLEIQ